MEMEIKIKLPPKSVSDRDSRVVHQGGEAPRASARCASPSSNTRGFGAGPSQTGEPPS
jgi:hypothetical protein